MNGFGRGLRGGGGGGALAKGIGDQRRLLGDVAPRQSGGGRCRGTAPGVARAATLVPGTRVTFGLDPILGMIPGLGDVSTPLFAALLIFHAVRFRIPRVVQLRMLLNALIDLGIGAIPLVGDLFDFGWKANVRNLALLERYARPGTSATRMDWAFVLVIFGLLAAMALIPMLVLAWLLSRFHLV